MYECTRTRNLFESSSSLPATATAMSASTAKTFVSSRVLVQVLRTSRECECKHVRTLCCAHETRTVSPFPIPGRRDRRFVWRLAHSGAGADADAVQTNGGGGCECEAPPSGRGAKVGGATRRDASSRFEAVVDALDRETANGPSAAAGDGRGAVGLPFDQWRAARSAQSPADDDAAREGCFISSAAPKRISSPLYGLRRGEAIGEMRRRNRRTIADRRRRRRIRPVLTLCSL